MPDVSEVVAFLISIGEAEAAPADSRGGGEIEALASDGAARTGDLAWLSPRNADAERVAAFRGTLLLCPRLPELRTTGDALAIPCSNPKLAFARVVDRFFPELMQISWPPIDGPSIHPSARIADSSRLARGVVIGSHTRIGDDVEIGPNTCIANASIARGVRIGANCSIGLSGFGYATDASGRRWRFPHTARVVIEEDVEIDSNTTVDRGSLVDTVLRRGCKIDNLVQVGHNVEIGEDAIVTAHCIIGGSTRVGPRAWIAPGARIMNQITIGADAFVGLGAVVLRDVADGVTVVGNPARPIQRKGNP